MIQTLNRSTTAITLYRIVNNKTRYYKIRLFLTLFGDVLLLKEYGGVKNKKPTGIKKEYYSNTEDAIVAKDRILSLKIARGYRL